MIWVVIRRWLLVIGNKYQAKCIRCHSSFAPMSLGRLTASMDCVLLDRIREERQRNMIIPLGWYSFQIVTTRTSSLSPNSKLSPLSPWKKCRDQRNYYHLTVHAIPLSVSSLVARCPSPIVSPSPLLWVLEEQVDVTKPANWINTQQRPFSLPGTLLS